MSSKKATNRAGLPPSSSSDLLAAVEDALEDVQFVNDALLRRQIPAAAPWKLIAQARVCLEKARDEMRRQANVES